RARSPARTGGSPPATRATAAAARRTVSCRYRPLTRAGGCSLRRFQRADLLEVRRLVRDGAFGQLLEAAPAFARHLAQARPVDCAAEETHAVEAPLAQVGQDGLQVGVLVVAIPYLLL